MTKIVDQVQLSGRSPGTNRFLTVHRYGQAGARPKVYIQASLHADEIPGMMAAHHLIALLDQAEDKGAIRGEIIVVPAANPVGLAQVVNGFHVGRHDLGGLGNFNRNWMDLSAGLAEAVADQLTQDGEKNVAVIRKAIGEKLSAKTVSGETPQLKLELMRLAFDADIVLDLHCDDDALMHIYMPPDQWEAYSDLAAELGAVACLTSIDSGSFCFDEGFYTPWIKLQQHYGDKFPIPTACCNSTVELRGQADVSDELGSQDAQALYRFLQRHSLIAGAAGAPPALQCAATPLDAADVIEAPMPGILAYRVELGDRVRKGDLIAELIDPIAPEVARARIRITAANDGFVLARRLHKMVTAGDTVAMIVGTESLKHRQEKLMTD